MLRVFLNDVCNKTITLPKHGYPFYSKESIRTALTEYISQRPQKGMPVFVLPCCDWGQLGGMKLPRSEFSCTTLTNASRVSFHCCTKCGERRNELQRKVCGTKIKCDCPGGVHQAAREKCAIFHHRLSHRWPGKDCGRGRNPFTWDDVQFLNRLPTVPAYSWWHKLWGRLCKKSN